MIYATTRCDEKPTHFFVRGKWTCSLEQGHPGDHGFHPGHNLAMSPLHRWPQGARPRPHQPAPTEPVAAVGPVVAPARLQLDEYDLLPDADERELCSLPSIEDMDRRDRAKWTSLG